MKTLQTPADTIGRRIKKIRKSLHLSQQSFGEPLGLSKAAISTYENGSRIPTESIKALICHCYKIRMQYLENGEGNMFSEVPDTFLQEIANKYNLDGLSIQIIYNYISLSSGERAGFNQYFLNYINHKKTTRE